MKMEELLSAAADEMEIKHTRKHGRSEDEEEDDHHPHPHHLDDCGSPSSTLDNDDSSTSSSSDKPTQKNASTNSNQQTNNNNNNNKPKASPRTTIRTRSKKDNPRLSVDTSNHDNDTQTVPSSANPSPSSSSSSPLSSSTSTTPTTSTTSPINGQTNAALDPKKLCKTVGCVVCTKGPPPSFTKGTPIWAQILHLVLYALTESAKVNVMGSPKMKVKRYFHLRDDIYEYISIHWDVICRRERIKNWRHTIGMTLSHYQNLFQNGYHIYQNTGYWSMKDNVPSPYVIDPLIGEGASPGKKRKYSHNNASSKPTDKAEKDSSSTNLTPFISEFPISPSMQHPGNQNVPIGMSDEGLRRLDLDGSGSDSMHNRSDEIRKSLHNSLLLHAQSHGHPSANEGRPQQGARFDEMKGAIDKFKREMAEIQAEIDSLQEQLQVKKAEEHLLKFLQEGISSFRDKIKNRIDLLKSEMQANHSEHQMQMHSMASELTQLREIGADLRNAFQYQFARLVGLHASQPQING